MGRRSSGASAEVIRDLFVVAFEVGLLFDALAATRRAPHGRLAHHHVPETRAVFDSESLTGCPESSRSDGIRKADERDEQSMLWAHASR